ncbi:MAG: hypothetical protein ABEH58_06180, partial [Haloplanus sp.]
SIMAGAPEPGGMVTYQFEMEDEEWAAWKETVPRSKSLDERLRELIRADAEGRVVEERDDDPRTGSETPEPTPAPERDPRSESTEPGGFSGEIVLGLEYDRELTDTRAEVLIEFVEWVASRDEGITKSDFEIEFWSDERASRTGYNAGSFWEQFAKAAMRQLDAFSKPNARTYRFVAGE